MEKLSVKLKPERRLSCKIIAHKIRKYSPTSYDLLLMMRLLLFKRKCNDQDGLFASYSDGSWVGRKTTSDLISIQKFLKEKSEIDVLQIGTGNMSLYKSLGPQLKSFYGLTIIIDELHFAEHIIKQSSDPTSKVFLLNKYTCKYDFLEGKQVDFIVDNDLASYACCIHHFNEMLKAYKEILKPGGSILVGIKGLGYFDTGFGLTINKLTNLAMKIDLFVVKSDFCYHLIKPTDEG